MNEKMGSKFECTYKKKKKKKKGSHFECIYKKKSTTPGDECIGKKSFFSKSQGAILKYSFNFRILNET